MVIIKQRDLACDERVEGELVNAAAGLCRDCVSETP